MKKIVLDAMGGDYAPAVTVEGAVRAVKELDIQVVLAGDEERILDILKDYTYPEEKIEIVNAPEVINMNDHPVKAVRRKKNSSIVKGAELVGEGKGDAFVSAGNTGAVLAAGIFKIGRIEGLERPAIATVIPTPEGPTLLVDAGANVDCKPGHLKDFALMGSIYFEELFGKKEPVVGLLSNGEEEEKGNNLVLQTAPLLEETGLNYLGHVEGRDIFGGSVDVVVCDGFVGNVVLKLTEGVARGLFGMLKEEFTSGFKNKIGALLLKSALKSVAARLDYTEYGGSPLLGLKKTAIICHGSSNAKAIYNALREAYRIEKVDVFKRIAQRVGSQGK